MIVLYVPYLCIVLFSAYILTYSYVNKYVLVRMTRFLCRTHHRVRHKGFGRNERYIGNLVLVPLLKPSTERYLSMYTCGIKRSEK